MIHAEFIRHGQRYVGFSVTGHAGFAGYGEDVVCAGVSSAVQMAANGITEVLKIPAQVICEENLISVRTAADACEKCDAFYRALHLQLTLIGNGYPDTVAIAEANLTNVPDEDESGARNDWEK